MEYFFTLNKAKYKIPSKMFPVARKSLLAHFDSENTVPLHHDPFKERIDAVTEFRVGFCYSNAELVLEIAKSCGLDVQYYAGWLFVGDVPVHHAWVVIGDNSLIDTSHNMRSYELLRQVDTSDPDWREKVAPKLLKIEETAKTSETCVLGQVPTDFRYVGCPDTIDNAKRIYRDLIRKYPNHPAYHGEGRNPRGASKLQKTLLKQGYYC